MSRWLAFLCFITLPLVAQSTHSVTLSWIAGADDTGFNIYRASGVCPASVSTTPITTGFAKVATLTSATPANYVDSTVVIGTYCYFITGTAGAARLYLRKEPATIVILCLIYNALLTEAGLSTRFLAMRDSMIYAVFLWAIFEIPEFKLRMQGKRGEPCQTT